MFLSDVSIKRPVFATMLMAALVTLGLFSYKRLAIDQWPDISFPFIVVQVPYPGASPETVERDVTRKIEETVNPIAGVRTLTSSSLEGISSVFIEFELGTNAMDAQQDVRAKVDQIRDDLAPRHRDASRPPIRSPGDPDRLARAPLGQEIAPRADDDRRRDDPQGARVGRRSRAGDAGRRREARDRGEPRSRAPRGARRDGRADHGHAGRREHGDPRRPPRTRSRGEARSDQGADRESRRLRQARRGCPAGGADPPGGRRDDPGFGGGGPVGRDGRWHSCDRDRPPEGLGREHRQGRRGTQEEGRGAARNVYRKGST